ncbi:MAG: nucleotide exchange factor GrpE [[Chlorobium] sp. 445]|nr:MAG: nucleotide exchange factor GrpE [[Chlorobium] sp. 445]
MPEETKQDEVKQEQEDISLQEQPSQQNADDATAMQAKTETPSLEARLAALEAERDEYKDLLLRKAAEFENFRRQKEREMSALIKFADKNLIKQILPILDDLERIITNSEKFLANHPDAKLYVDGVKLVHQKMLKILETRQVKRMETLGKKFDHNFHEALTQMPKADLEPDIIVEEFEAGYTMHDEVIRHAKVVVSKPVE